MGDRSLELPSEVLARIFTNLPRDRQRVCLSVCKSWYLSAGRLYYQAAHIDEIHSGDEIPKISNCLKISSGLLAGHFIKTISIERRNSCSPYKRRSTATKEQLAQLLELCPNLQEIAFSFNSIYWKYLHEIPKVNELHCVRKICKKEPQILYETQYFYQAAYQYRKSITDLEVHRSCDSSLYESYNNLFDYLSAFPKLQVLAITSGSQQHLIYFDQLLGTCSQLIRLNYQLDHPFFRPNNAASATGTNNSAVWPAYSSMQELDLYLPYFDIQALRYINNRFVNMKRLTLRLNQNDEDQRRHCCTDMINPSVNTVREFFRNDFMQMIDAFDFSHLLFQINGQSYLEGLISEFYRFKCSTKEDTATASYIVHDGRRERTQISLKKERKASGALSFAIDYTFVRDLSSNSSPSSPENTLQCNLPYIKHLQSYGTHLKSLKITHTAEVKRKDVSDILLVLELCSRLENLIVHIDLNHFPYEVSPSYQDELITEQRQSNQIKGNPRLKSLVLNGAYISSSLLGTIAINNPNIEILNLIKCILKCDEHQLLDGLNNQMIHFDLHTLKLKSLAFDVGPYLTITEMIVPTPTICIVIERERGLCNYYLVNQRFKHVSRSYYEEQIIADYKRKTTVLWFVVGSLNTLVIPKGRNLLKVLSFPDETPMISI
jgi:hypothetical protein